MTPEERFEHIEQAIVQIVDIQRELRKAMLEARSILDSLNGFGRNGHQQ